MTKIRFPYGEYMEKITCGYSDAPIEDDSIYVNQNNGVWIADKNGIRINYYSGMSILSAVWDRHDERWYRNQKNLSQGIADAEKYGQLAEAENVTATELVHNADGNLVPSGRSHKAVMLTRYENGLPIKVCVNAKLLKGFPKNAMYYTTGSHGPVMVCLPETINRDGTMGAIKPIAIVMPFQFWRYEITHRD